MPTPLLHPKDPLWVDMILNDLKNENHVRAFSDYCQSYNMDGLFGRLNDLLTRFCDLAALLNPQKHPNVLAIKASNEYILALPGALGRYPWQVYLRISLNGLYSLEALLAIHVIPQLDALHDSLHHVASGSTESHSCRRAAKVALQHLGKVYEPSTHSFLYAIMNVLHPRLKTAYLRERGWDETSISALVKYCRKVWDLSYKRFDERSAKIALLPENLARDWKTDAFESYIKAPIEHSCLDPLRHWEDMKATGLDVGLCQMAIDYLSIPASVQSADDGLQFFYTHSQEAASGLDDPELVYSALLRLWNDDRAARA
ncbi:hypothetical protein SISSUDRAFT_1066459 [Sistotremastrum suecicum HHB10207 ss-3]|uniref:Uncharacterized protein n=1 Tax=Sistotremastrum suecicum HHB10207 ss-3 TaxID=1314776 RepID=A0A165YB48_9AGAM|nr:hypothetical protein SISSUDRAFT_1066459 [Sistotremastrum suecicum HHB10207 ss-3]